MNYHWLFALFVQTVLILPGRSVDGRACGNPLRRGAAVPHVPARGDGGAAMTAPGCHRIPDRAHLRAVRGVLADRRRPALDSRRLVVHIWWIVVVATLCGHGDEIGDLPHADAAITGVAFVVTTSALSARCTGCA